MKSVYCLNPISNAGMSRFDDTYCIADSIENADAVLLRSASMHEMTLPDSLLAIGRAGAGVNNIPLDSCAKIEGESKFGKHSHSILPFSEISAAVQYYRQELG